MVTHPKIDSVVRDYLRVADTLAPGLVEGLYLEGSAALGDYRPATSDIDFVAVTRERPLTANLELIHQKLGSAAFDGIYLTWDDLRRDPAETGSRPHVHEGRLGTATGSPVTWHTLARYGVACRGPEVGDLDIWADPEALARWTVGNFDAYWARILDRASRPVGRWGLAMLAPYGVLWIVTGVSRLHYTLATGDITSKEGAARYVLTAFPERWHRVAHEALRIRRTDLARPTLRGLCGGLAEHAGVFGKESRRSLYRSPLARRDDVLAFATMVIADAHRSAGPGHVML